MSLQNLNNTEMSNSSEHCASLLIFAIFNSMNAVFFFPSQNGKTGFWSLFYLDIT